MSILLTSGNINPVASGTINIMGAGNYAITGLQFFLSLLGTNAAGIAATTNQFSNSVSGIFYSTAWQFNSPGAGTFFPTYLYTMPQTDPLILGRGGTINIVVAFSGPTTVTFGSYNIYGFNLP